MASGWYSSGSASIIGCQNSEDDTLPCTKSTAGPVRPGTESTLAVRRLVAIRSALIPGSNVSTVSSRGPGY